MEGRIVALSCGIYSVLADGIIFKVPARGLFRIKKTKPVVGDRVDVNEENCVITFIYERTSFLKRPVVANLDQMIIVQSLTKPEFSYSLLFKYITYANSNGIKSIIILTKSDEFNDDNKVKEILDVFNTLNIEIHIVSNKTKEGLDEVRSIFANKTSCLIGQTGVGKSSLVNSIDENFAREVGEYSWALGRGKHKTKEVILLPYQNGFIVDTPGFSSLDLELYKEDLAMYFPGCYERYEKCYYPNCLHISESKCDIKEAVNQKKIPEIAYQEYLKISQEAIFKTRRFYK